MYEHLRNCFLLELTPQFDNDEIERILRALDKAAANYDITEKVTALAVIDDTNMKIARFYLASKKQEGCADATIKSYADTLRLMFAFIEKPLEEIQVNDVRMYLAQYQQQRGTSNRTMDKYRQTIGGFFEWALNEEYITKNPCRNIKGIKYTAKQRKSLTRLQLERLRRSCKTKRDLAIIDVLYSTACRVSELTNMKLTDVDFQNGKIEIIGKGNKPNTVYLNDAARLSLEDYLAERNDDSEYLFVGLRKPHGKIDKRSVEHVFAKLGKQFNMQLCPHMIRHTSATLALKGGMTITQVQKMLGHASVNTTQIYAETSQEDVAEAHRRYVV